MAGTCELTDAEMIVSSCNLKINGLHKCTPYRVTQYGVIDHGYMLAYLCFLLDVTSTDHLILWCELHYSRDWSFDCVGNDGDG